MACAIFYTHQTSGMCPGMCACDCMHQMEKSEATEIYLKHSFIYLIWLEESGISYEDWKM